MTCEPPSVGMGSLILSITQMQASPKCRNLFCSKLATLIALQLLLSFLAWSARTMTQLSRAVLLEETFYSSGKSAVVEFSIDSEEHNGTK